MRLSELKKLVDDAVEQMTKHREDPEVGFYRLENGPGDQYHQLVGIEAAEITSVSNLEFHSIGLLGCHEINMDVPMKSLFILCDDADQEVFH